MAMYLDANFVVIFAFVLRLIKACVYSVETYIDIGYAYNGTNKIIDLENSQTTIIHHGSSGSGNGVNLRSHACIC